MALSLSGKLVKKALITSDANAFLQVFGYRPYLIPNMSPANIKSIDLVGGEWGVVGSLLNWTYVLDGNVIVAKEVVEAIDMGNKLVHFKVIDGALMDLYKSFSLTINGDITGEENSVTWILTYEKLNESVEDPNTLMDFCLIVTKDIDIQLLKDQTN